MGKKGKVLNPADHFRTGDSGGGRGEEATRPREAARPRERGEEATRPRERGA